MTSTSSFSVKIIGLMLSLIIFSCTPKDVETVSIIKHGKHKEYIIHTKYIKDTLHLKLSDFASDFEFIALETREDCMISYGTKYYINDDYFLMEKHNGNIYQFRRNGKFMRILVKRGKGPTEFMRGDWTVDDNNQILYLTDEAKKNYFLRFDLITGKYLGDLKKAVLGRTYNIEYVKEDLILGSPSGKYEEGILSDYLFFQDLEGNKISSIPAPSLPSLLWNNITYAYSEDIFRFETTNSDTIFSVAEDQLIPYLTFDLGRENPSDRFIMGHTEFEIDKEVESWLALEVARLDRVVKNKDGQIVDMSSKMSFITLDKKGNKAYHKSSLYIDPTDDPNGFWIFFCNNGQFVKPYDAYSLLELSEKAFKNPEFNEKYETKLEEITRYLKVDDNPVLLVGKYK